MVYSVMVYGVKCCRENILKGTSYNGLVIPIKVLGMIQIYGVALSNYSLGSTEVWLGRLAQVLMF